MTVVEEEFDARYFSWRGWVSRQVSRQDRVGRWARASVAGMPPELRPAGEAAARAEYDAFFRQNYPRSPAARAAAEFVAELEAGRTVDPEPEEPTPQTNADTATLLAEALDDVRELLVEALRFSAPAERQDRLRSVQYRLTERIAALRRAAAVRSP